MIPVIQFAHLKHQPSLEGVFASLTVGEYRSDVAKRVLEVMPGVSWMAETTGESLNCGRHFLASMFDSELSAAGGQWKPVAIGFFTLLLPGGMLLMDRARGKVALSGSVGYTRGFQAP